MAESRIWTVIPYSYQDDNKKPRLDLAYNRFMQLIPEQDWLLILDHDTFLTYRFWYKECERTIKRYPNAGMFTVKCNIPGDKSNKATAANRYGTSDWYDIRKQIAEGRKLYAKKKGRISEWHNKTTGYFMLIRKAVWEEIKNEIKAGFSKVDTSIGKRIKDYGYKIYCIDSLFVCHYILKAKYRL